MTVTVCCVKAKPAYDHHYVNRLYRGVQKHLSVPHRFVCLTDNPFGVKCPTKKLPFGLNGWWAKLALHRKGLLDGLCIYFDLDTLIVGSLDFLADYEGDYAILRDFYRPRGYGSGVMMWNKPRPDIWDEWLNRGAPDHPLGDQGWMEQILGKADGLQDLYPDAFVSYKEHCQAGIPQGARVVCFHGFPKQTDFEPDHWVTKTWNE